MKAYEEVDFGFVILRWIKEGSVYKCTLTEEQINQIIDQSQSNNKSISQERLIVGKRLIDFYRQYFDDEGDDITVQVERYVKDYYERDNRLDEIEALLRKQAQAITDN
jgi:hypothetical protein